MTWWRSSPLIVRLLLGALLLTYVAISWRMGGSPVWGPYKVRQADTMYAGYSMCMHGTGPFLPRIIDRRDTSGIAIGELPVMAWAFAVPCLLTGHWSERLARMVNLLLFVLALVLWARWLSRRHDVPELPGYWMLLFATTFLHLETFLTPLPDTAALLLTGLAADMWGNESRGKLRPLAAAACFTAGILARPYFFLLLFVIAPPRRDIVRTSVVAVAGYLAWYHGWFYRSEILYYAVRPTPLLEVLAALPTLPQELFVPVVWKHFNGVGVGVFLWAIWRSQSKRLGWLWAITLLGVVLAKGENVLVQPYYALGASVIASMIVARETVSWSPSSRYTFLALHVLVGFASLQPMLEEPTAQSQARLRSIVSLSSNPTDRFASYHTRESYWLYVINRAGWARDVEDYDRARPCPPQTEFLIRKDAEGSTEVQRCP